MRSPDWPRAPLFVTIRVTMMTAFAVLLLVGTALVGGYLFVMAVTFVLDWTSQRR